jgi:hypothetical protein
LLVTGGTLRYRGVTGSGEFDGWLDHENRRIRNLAPTWGGTLYLLP